MCPEPSGTIPDILGSNVTIAWDGSREASRAVITCLPILTRGKNGDNPNRQVKRGECKASRVAGISVSAWHFI